MTASRARSPTFQTMFGVELLAHLVLLREKGGSSGRPEVDTLEGSRHANMKELRVKVLKVQWRFALPSIRNERLWFSAVVRRAV